MAPSPTATLYEPSMLASSASVPTGRVADAGGIAEKRLETGGRIVVPC